jgi:nucleotide-binding universal stress UspA family protein
MEPTIICAVEKRTAEAVVGTAGELARHLGARVVVVHIRPEPALNSPDRRERARHLTASEGRETLQEVERLLPDGVRVHERVALGEAGEQLSAVAGELHAALIVVGRDHHTPLFSLRRGSVSQKLAREAPCPVVIVSGSPRLQRDQANRATPWTVIAGVDGTEESTNATLFAKDLADRLGDRLLLVHAHPSPAAFTIHAGGPGEAGVSIPDSIWEALGHSGNGAGFVVGGAPPAHTLQAVAAREKARLIVIGAGSDDGPGALLRGSVSAQLPRLATCPVVIVPKRAAAPVRHAAAPEVRRAA